MKMLVMLLMMLVLFLGGVIVGIDQANEGVTETRGYTTSEYNDAIQTELTDQGTYQVKVMGRNFQQINLERKEQQYEEIQSTHFTQQLAGNLEYTVQWFYNQMIHSAYQIAQSFF